jgi:PKD repeat protein
VHEYTHPGYYNVELSTYNPNTGCIDHFERVILIASQGNDCSADFIYRIDPATRKVKFIDKSIGRIKSYLWNFGEVNGLPSKLPNPGYDYSKPGYYTACLTVVDSTGISNITCKKIGIGTTDLNSVKSDFIYIIDSVSKKATFSDISYGNPDSWEWDFGDGSTSSIQNPFHVYAKAGYYLVSLNAKNSTTGYSNRTFKLLKVGLSLREFKAAFGYNSLGYSTKAGGGYPVDFVGAGVGDHARLRWNFGDSTAYDSTTNAPTHVYSKEGQYFVCFAIEDPITGLGDTICQYISTSATGIKPITLTKTELFVYPNPFTGNTTISYSVAKPTNLEIAIFDLSGRKVNTVLKTKVSAGSYNVEWNGSELDKGSYIVRFTENNGEQITRLIIKQ